MMGDDSAGFRLFHGGVRFTLLATRDFFLAANFHKETESTPGTQKNHLRAHAPVIC